MAKNGRVHWKWLWQTESGNWIKGLGSITREIRVFSRTVPHLLKESGVALPDGLKKSKYAHWIKGLVSITREILVFSRAVPH